VIEIGCGLSRGTPTTVGESHAWDERPDEYGVHATICLRCRPTRMRRRRRARASPLRASDVLAYQETSGSTTSTYIPLTDVLGSTIGLINSSGSITIKIDGSLS